MSLSNNISMFPRMLMNCTSIILHHNQTLLVPGDLPPDIPVLMATNPLVMMRDPQADGRSSPDCCPLVVVSVVNLTRQQLLKTCMSKIRQRGAKFLLIMRDSLNMANIGEMETNFECFLTSENPQGYPKPIPFIWTIVSPFSNQVWLYSFVSMSFLIACLLLIIRLARSLPPGSLFTIVTGQTEKRNTHITVLFCSAFMALYILSMAYKGNLLAQLVRVEYEAPVDTFQDVLDRRLGLYTLKESIAVWLMKYSPNPIHRKVFHQGLKHGGLLGARNANKTVLSHMVSGEAGMIINDAGIPGFRHMFRPSREILAEVNLGFAYQKNLPIRREINSVLAMLKDTGIVGALLDREIWKMSFQEREHHRNSKPKEANIPINLDHIIGISFIVLAGFVSSVISLIIEKYFIHEDSSVQYSKNNWIGQL